MRMTKTKQFALLRSLPGFAGSTDRELERLAALVDEGVVEAGHFLMRQGTSGRQAMVIVEGQARVVVDGTEVAAVGPGDIIGEVAMLDHSFRCASVVAVTRTRVLAVGPSQWGDFVGHPTVLSLLTRQLAGRVRDADALIAARPVAVSAGGG